MFQYSSCKVLLPIFISLWHASTLSLEVTQLWRACTTSSYLLHCSLFNTFLLLCNLFLHLLSYQCCFYIRMALFIILYNFYCSTAMFSCNLLFSFSMPVIISTLYRGLLLHYSIHFFYFDSEHYLINRKWNHISEEFFILYELRS